MLQEYTNDPLLYEGRKVDFRFYVVFFLGRAVRIKTVPGFAKIAPREYSRDSLNVSLEV